MTGLAAVLLALATWLALPGRGSVERRSRPAVPLPVLAGAAVGLVVVLVPAGWWVPALTGTGAAAAGAALLRRRRDHAVAVAAGDRVLEVCEQLASELASGQPPGAALGRSAASWPPLSPVAEAFRVGADVPEALRDVARVPGGHDLRLLAAAWQVSHRTGQGLAEAVDRVAGGLRAAQSSRRLVRGELASARATARLVAVLPVVALAMGSGAGGDPGAFLLQRPVGQACLVTGLAFGLLGLWWIESIARAVDRSP
ncbi:type II secretion system F family protein [Nocardioides sp. SYSU D00038]|uniref:type II secretion system F family protein n=1 Tax=Nocardioides sp. SYSU D00038 TaxID=2812554 RepID=UPI001967DCCF|nr:type II secretion system F family protein [Nocardioides sp. SYSU D00038]